jgi:hypothetical protein
VEVGALSGEARGGDGRDSVDACRGRGLSAVVGVRIGRALCGGGVTALTTEIVVS